MSAAASHEPAHVAASPAFQPPPGNPRFPLVDSLRAVAILMVLTAHAAGAAELLGAANVTRSADLARQLGSGVLVFFVISGFLIYRPFVAARVLGRPRPRFSRYFRRRALRLLPAYWFALFVLTAVGLAHGGAFGADWWRYWTLLHIYWPDSHSGGLQVAWSLALEASFYATLPLWVLAMERLQRSATSWFRIEAAGIAILIAGCLVFRALIRTVTIPENWGSALPATGVYFLLGMALASITVLIEQRGRTTRLERAIERFPLVVWLLAAALFTYAALNFAFRYTVEGQTWAAFYGNYVFSALASFLLVLPAVVGHERARGLPRKLLAQPWLAWLGLVSYGFFLWHLPLMLKLKALGIDDRVPGSDMLVLMLGGLALGTLAGAFSYYVVELPFLDLKEGPLRIPRLRRPLLSGGGDAALRRPRRGRR